MFGRKPRPPVDDEFEVTFPLMKSRSTHQYVEKLKDRLQWAFKVAKEHIDKDQKRRKLYYDRKVHCMDIIPGELVLVRQKVFGPTHKIEDLWEIPVYKVIDKDAKSTVFQVQKLGSTEPKRSGLCIGICCFHLLVLWRILKLTLQWKSRTLQSHQLVTLVCKP